MAFASRADLLARSNARRLAQLAIPADRAMPPDDAFRIAITGGGLSACGADDRASVALGLDAADKALADADALILTYGIPESARNTLLARIASTIALYYLQGAERMTEDVRKAYQDALDLLKAHARGDNNLIPATPPPADTVNDQAIIYSSPPRYGAGVDGGWVMISLTPLIRHIKDGGAGFDGLWFRQVAGAAEYAQIRPDALPLPAAWVVRNADRIRHAGERAENVGMVFDVVIAIENARVHQAGETDDLLLKYRKKVKDLLLGWQIAPDVRPVNFEGGRVIEYTDADLYWADKYSFEALITSYLPDPGGFDKIVNTGDGL